MSAHRSTGRDPVLLALKAAAAVLAVVAVVMLTHLIQHTQAVADHPCPAPDHPVWIEQAHAWGCAQSITFGVRSR